MLKPGMFLSPIDIKDAFYSALIFLRYRKYLRFVWNTKIYQFYLNAMQIFNKLLKPVFVSLYEFGYELSVYMYDSLLLALKFEECFDNVFSTISLLQELGYVIQSTKSIFVLTQKITLLGFKIDALNTTLTLISKKKEK